MMKQNGDDLLNTLGNFPRTTFENHFSTVCRWLNLGGALNREELELLYNAAFLGTLCNIAFNGIGGCQGAIRADREPHRMGLEREFMAACDRLYSMPGWQALPDPRQTQIYRSFLRVLVANHNLAQ